MVGLDGSLSLKGLVKRFDALQVIHDVSFEVAHGEFVVFVGPSGCGKSTLLRMICGLETASAGEIRIGGVRVNELPAARRGLALVFQSYALYPHMSVYQNMAFGLENLGMPKAEILSRVDAAARMLKLEAYLGRKPTALSGGQRQRVAIGRAIVREPRIFLFDEPLSNLDAELRLGMRAELKDLHRRLGTTMIYVTHDQVEAMTMADKIVVLRGGRVEQVGPPLELYNHPANRFVAGFIGSPRMNFLEGRVDAVTAEGVTVEIPDVGRFRAAATGAVSGDIVTIGIRPEHIEGSQGPENNLSGLVGAIEQLGGLSHMRLVNPMITWQSLGQSRLVIGDEALLHFPADRLHLFDRDGIRLPALF